MSQDPNSANLEDLKKVLAKSFDGAEGEDVPPLPESLRDRIADQYGRSAEPAPKEQSEGFFAWLTSLFAQPAFAGAAAALVLLVTASVLLWNPDDSGQFRNGSGSNTSAVTLVLYQIDDATAASLREADLFDEKATRVATTASELEAIAPPRIVLDGSTETIRAFAEGSDAPLEADLPADPQQLADKVAELLQQIR